MENIIKHYTREDVTVVWQPSLCIHSRKCFTGLSEVFNPQSHPWVNMDGATLTAITDQISHCPSGALSYTKNNSGTAGDKGPEGNADIVVEVMKNGPLLVYGNINVKDAYGKEIKKSKVTAFCRCGTSASKPYCDGAHVTAGFKDS
jgi:uncharacterized Fe-S cluster protein YjdI